MTDISASRSLGLETRKNNSIVNHLDDVAVLDGEILEIQALKREYSQAKHRPVGPSSLYNCHGLTFAARRTQISDPSEVQKILKDDDYKEVAMGEVLPGDIVVYYKDGDIEHSGVVVEKETLVPWVLSKWGSGHEVIHAVGDTPYDAPETKYYRLIR